MTYILLKGYIDNKTKSSPSGLNSSLVLFWKEPWKIHSGKLEFKDIYFSITLCLLTTKRRAPFFKLSGHEKAEGTWHLRLIRIIRLRNIKIFKKFLLHIQCFWCPSWYWLDHRKTGNEYDKELRKKSYLPKFVFKLKIASWSWW